MILSRDVLSIFTLRFLVKDALSIFAQRFLVKGALSISTLWYPLYIYSMILKSQLNSVHKSYHLLIIDFSLMNHRVNIERISFTKNHRVNIERASFTMNHKTNIERVSNTKNHRVNIDMASFTKNHRVKIEREHPILRIFEQI